VCCWKWPEGLFLKLKCDDTIKEPESELLARGSISNPQAKVHFGPMLGDVSYSSGSSHPFTCDNPRVKAKKLMQGLKYS